MDLMKLQALAEAAQPGPWECRELDGITAVASPGGWVMDGLDDQDILDARYVAAANPATMLELIALVQRQEAELKTERARLQGALRGSPSWFDDDRAAQPPAAPVAQPEAQGVLTGWKLVPVEPTPKMSAAGFCVSEAEHDPAGVYLAMLAAAPLPPQGVEEARYV